MTVAIRPGSAASPFSDDSEARGRSAERCSTSSWRAPSRPFPRDLRADLPELLWLAQLGVTLFWVHDSSPDQRRTRTLVDGVAPLVGRLVRLSRLPVLRGAVRRRPEPDPGGAVVSAPRPGDAGDRARVRRASGCSSWCPSASAWWAARSRDRARRGGSSRGRAERRPCGSPSVAGRLRSRCRGWWRARSWRSPGSSSRRAASGPGWPGVAVGLATPLVGALALVAERAGWGLLGYSGDYLTLTVPHMLFAGFGACLVAGLALEDRRAAHWAAWTVPIGVLLVLVGYFVGDVAELVGALVLTAGLYGVAIATLRALPARGRRACCSWWARRPCWPRCCSRCGGRSARRPASRTRGSRDGRDPRRRERARVRAGDPRRSEVARSEAVRGRPGGPTYAESARPAGVRCPRATATWTRGSSSAATRRAPTWRPAATTCWRGPRTGAPACSSTPTLRPEEVWSRPGSGSGRSACASRARSCGSNATGRRVGFGYGTRDRAPDQRRGGFVVELDDDGSLWFHVRAFSRPVHAWLRAGRAPGAAGQRAYVRRLARAVRLAPVGDPAAVR